MLYLGLTWYKRWTDAGRPQSTKTFRLPLPILVVLYNGKEKWGGELDLKSLVSAVPPELEPFIPVIRVLFIPLNQFDKKHLPGRPETRAVVESMIRATDGTFVVGLGSVIGHFKDSTLDERILELIEDIVLYCDWTEDVTPDTVDKILSNVVEGQEDNKMSQAVKQVRKTFERIARESYVAESEARGGARTIIRFLNSRFQKVPKSIKDKVSAITDINRLDELTDQAAVCQSMDEFVAALK